jgi:ribonuclease HI
MIAYTDGSANPHDGGSGGWAFVLVNKRGQVTEKRSGGFSKGRTNNSMEMTAVLRCLDFVEPNTNITVYTDSKLVIGWLSKSWKCKHQHLRTIRDQIFEIIKAKRLQVKYQHVKGHGKCVENNLADELANQARKGAIDARRTRRTIRL